MNNTTNTYRDGYIQMLAGRGFAIGERVVCEYRTPSPTQCWIHSFHVGVIADVDEIQAKRCVALRTVAVNYLPAKGESAGFRQEDLLSSLRSVIGGEEIIHSPYFNEHQPQALYE